MYSGAFVAGTATVGLTISLRRLKIHGGGCYGGKSLRLAGAVVVSCVILRSIGRWKREDVKLKREAENKPEGKKKKLLWTKFLPSLSSVTPS